MKLILIYFISLQANSQTDQNQVVMTSFSVIQSLVQQIAPPSVKVQTLVPLEGDPHDHQLSLHDMMKFKDLKMYFYFGYGVDDHLLSKQKNLNKCQVSRDLTLIKDRTNQFDPHAWQDPQMGIQMAANILFCLKSIFPDQEKLMQQNLKNLSSTLNKISSEYKKLFNKVPLENLKIVTPHAAFQYLQTPFNLQIISMQGLHSHHEPSARTMQKLIDQITNQNVQYLFPEKPEVTTTLKRLQILTQLKMGPRLYSDTLSDSKGPAATYQNLVKHNLSSIYQALKLKDK